MAWVYLLECSDGSLYCGWTMNLEKRVVAHNQGVASKYTRARLPVKLVYQEKREDKRAAMRREYEIKQMSRRNKLALLLKPIRV